MAAPARDEVDEVALTMLRELVDSRRYEIELTTTDMLSSELNALVEQKKPTVICIAALPPGGLAHTRYLCKRLRARFPDLKIIVGRWGLKGNVDKNQEQLKAAGTHLFGTTLAETRNQIIQLLRLVPSKSEKQEPAETKGDLRVFAG